MAATVHLVHAKPMALEEPVTRIGISGSWACRVPEGILAGEEEHADDLASLLRSFD